MGDPDSPIVSKCQVLTRATQRVVDRLNEDQALRPGMDAVTMCRLVGGVAAVADQGDLDADRRASAARGRRRRHDRRLTRAPEPRPTRRAPEYHRLAGS